MGGGGGGGEGGVAHLRELDKTPTWAVSGICAIIIIISILLELVIHMIGHWFHKRKKAALYEALDKVKSELMVLGFISLLLTFGQNYIARICIPVKVADTMLPCPVTTHFPSDDDHHRKLLSFRRRFLGGGAAAPACKPGRIPLISTNGLHQLHIFIFFLAVFHVIYSAITMTLGRLKIRGWKEWERDVHREQDAMNDPSRFRLTHEISFVKDHMRWWNKSKVTFYLVCFFRQFFRSVRKHDYLTMRHGFVSVHLAPGSKFDFQKYIKRSLEDDFKVVVGITPVLWTSMMIFLLANVHGWEILMLMISMLPLIVVLAVGTKLQGIISNMALDIQERHAVVQGIPLVQVSDTYFWFSKPRWCLHFLHFVLFQNAFEITHFFWIWYEFGLKSCFHEDFNFAVIRVCLGVLVQFLCSYITLPLYALVTQMGSTMKKSIFDDQTSKALKNWRKNAGKKKPIDSIKPKSSTGSPGSHQQHQPSDSLDMDAVETKPLEMASVDVQQDPLVDINSDHLL